MGYRLSKIITKTGDLGSTGLGNGERVVKSHERVVAMGDVDELNSAIGMLIGHDIASDIADALSMMQHHLFDLGAELAVPGYVVLTEAHVAWLEKIVLPWHEVLAPLDEFILPGGTPAAATTHLVRAICRRAERSCVAVAQIADETVNPFLLQYLNRASDCFFILARYINHLQNTADTLWHKTQWNELGEPTLLMRKKPL